METSFFSPIFIRTLQSLLYSNTLLILFYLIGIHCALNAQDIKTNRGLPTTTANAANSRVLAGDGYIKMNIRLPFATQAAEYFVKKEGHYFILNDDIIVGNDFPKTQSYAQNNRDYKWRNAEIPIFIDNSILDNNMQKMVCDALNAMNRQLELSLIPYTNQEDYVSIQFSSAIKGAGQSPVGRQGGEQPLFLSGSASQATIWHELLHAAGIYHEQSRSDRDKFVRIHTENMTSGTEHNFQIEAGTAFGGYDFCSIMHYSSMAFSKNNQTTIECLSNNQTTTCPPCMGQRSGFSEQDKKGLDQFYNEVSRFPSNYVFVPRPSFQSSWRYCGKCHAMFYDGYEQKGSCPADALVAQNEHSAIGYNFVLPHDVAQTNNAQALWRYCGKCHTMFYDGYPQKGACSGGNEHTAIGYNFTLPHDIAQTNNAQASWRYCGKCHEMFYDGYADKGHCKTGGGHAAIGYNFVLPHDVAQTNNAQASWRYCGKCHAMFYDGYAQKGACPAPVAPVNHGHVAAGYVFSLPHDAPGTNTTQTEWRYCGKCHVMFYDGYPQKGACSSGGGHTSIGYMFVLPHDVQPSSKTQAAWRYCDKCHVMFYDGYAQKGACAAGGGHNASGYNFVLGFN